MRHILATALLLGLAACATPERQVILDACHGGDYQACVLAEQQRIAELDAVYGNQVLVW
ncbi:MAG TPA: hypothetical protein PKA33_01550 [Amaricoccus sp.]|uniref:hypothetical protein n=1 Tax=Amaricoccus sp. TaxID=1872485 RepID=UPI002BE41BFB|nr:hypothetical protein [Amaricoccus sp.]HMR51220.1 hypothetical protein [Amaricoccus sp.]HMT98031.1 hypothetical protein [Amaricoccus sp.]